MTPLALVRQALMQLCKSQIPLTPENFRRVYDEIAGIKLLDYAAILSKSPGNVLHKMVSLST